MASWDSGVWRDPVSDLGKKARHTLDHRLAFCIGTADGDIGTSVASYTHV